MLLTGKKKHRRLNEQLGLRGKAKSCVECAICLEVITAETLDTTPCGHNFHKDCLNKLKETKEVGKKTVPCPHCRKELWCIKSK